MSADSSWIVSEPVEGGPYDGSVIPSFLGHVASRIGRAGERGPLKCQTRVNFLRQHSARFSDMSEAAQRMVQGTGLAHLTASMFDHIDAALISAFVERWQPDTNTFHMPFGEMTIMLHDVWQILRVPVEGEMITAEPPVDELKLETRSMLSVPDLTAEHYDGGGVKVEAIVRHCLRRSFRMNETVAAAWLWLTLGSTLFTDKSGNRVRPALMWEMRREVEPVGQLSWGSAALAYLYRHLGVASRGDCTGMAGCLTLLQAWIYEYFPSLRPHRERVYIGPHQPRVRMWVPRSEPNTYERLQTLRQLLDRMTADEVKMFFMI